VCLDSGNKASGTPCPGGQCNASGACLAAVVGACGGADGQALASAPSGAALCASGTASSVTGAGPWAWTCDGANGGGSASCAASLLASGCGTAQGTTTATAPTTNLCASGTPSAVTASTLPSIAATGAAPLTTYRWNWTCTSGTTASCFANRPQPCGGVNNVRSISALPAGAITCTNGSSGGSVTGVTVLTGKSTCTGGDLCHCGVGTFHANCAGSSLVSGTCDDMTTTGWRGLGVVRFTWNGVVYQSNFVQLGGTLSNPSTFVCRLSW
jgi:hypothetical protein